METAFVAFIYYGISWFLSIGALLWFLNFLTRGFIINFFRAKGSRGAKILIRAEDISGKYWTIGYVTNDKTFEFQTRSKSKRQATDLDAVKSGFYQFMTVTCIDINETKDLVVVYPANQNIEYVPLTTSDTADAMLKLHATKPTLGVDKQLVMLILLVVILLILCGIGFMEYQNGQTLMYIAKHQANQSVITIGGGL